MRSGAPALLLLLFPVLVPGALPAADLPAPRNLLLNPEFGFHSFANSRTGSPVSYRSRVVACWNQDAYGDAEGYRAPRVTALRPRFPVDGGSDPSREAVLPVLPSRGDGSRPRRSSQPGAATGDRGSH